MSDSDGSNYTAVIDQDEVTEEVRNIAVKYDPLNRSGGEGFYIEDGVLKIDDEKVMREHKIIQNKIPNNSVNIVELPSETGELVHQYGKNGFKLFNLPELREGDIIGLIGKNGIGKSTVLKILSRTQIPNFGDFTTESTIDRFLNRFKGTRLQSHIESLKDNSENIIYKPQRVSESQLPSNKSVREFLTGREISVSKFEDELELSGIMNSNLEELSGGERQRVYIAAVLMSDADTYLIDEPTSFLDIRQRFKIGRLIKKHIKETEAKCIIVEHDMAFLDLVSDYINIIYGENNGYGVVSKQMTSKNGINSYVNGYLPREEIQIRPEKIAFSSIEERTEVFGEVSFEYPRFSRTFDDFILNVESGSVYENEVLGIVGQNALGKTTFANILSGRIQPDNRDLSVDKKISYKPQYPSSSTDKTVQELFISKTDTTSIKFKNRIYRPLELDNFYENPISELSGGELQRVAVGLCLSREADAYLLDEPSAYLDIESRAKVSSTLRKFARDMSKPVMVIDHDLFVIDRIADRVIHFEGTPGKEGRANTPQKTKKGMNDFLSNIGITFRRDRDTNRPRANKHNSQLDREQKKNDNYY